MVAVVVILLDADVAVAYLLGLLIERSRGTQGIASRRVARRRVTSRSMLEDEFTPGVISLPDLVNSV